MFRRLTAKFYFANDKRKCNVLMTNEKTSTPKNMTNESVNTLRNETHTWLEPGAWRKPCIVHVTMVANARQAVRGLSCSCRKAMEVTLPAWECRCSWPFLVVKVGYEGRQSRLCPSCSKQVAYLLPRSSVDVAEK